MTKACLSYVPLKNHTSYSLLEGAITPEKMMQRALEQNLVAVGMTDTANLFGAMEFSLLAQKNGLKPIIGCLLPVDTPEADDKPFPLPLFAQNKAGYQNLCRLVSALTVNKEGKPVDGVPYALLEKHAHGLIALTGGPKGALEALHEQDHPTAEAWLKRLHALFPNRLYIELCRLPEPGPHEKQLIEAAYAHNLPLVATNEAFFLDEADHAAHDALLCIKETSYVNEVNRRRETPHHRLKSPDEMAGLFADIPEALANTVQLATRCSVLLEEQPPALPPYPVPPDTTQEAVLKKLAEDGLAERLKNVPAERHAAYHERLAYELSVITSMGFVGYFLIVADFIGWAKKNSIAVGPGRGSGAGSLVAWSLLITDADPLRFGLLFERFLNPERVSMPDFDIDFCPERRDEVIAYVRDTYGAASVAHIITFGKLQARAVLRDVGRVLSMPYGQVDKIAKRIPFNPAHPVTLAQALEEDSELDDMRQNDATVGQLFDFAQRLEGLYRHASTHAAGVVIADGALTDLMPLYQDPKSALPATQFSMKYVEKSGLVKFDFLGLKTLTVLEESVKHVKELAGETIDLSTLPLDDKPTFELLRAGHVMGLFQLESAGMRDVLHQLQPEAFEELIALVALYRPGPMDDIPHYLACRHGREKVTYPYACLEDILKETFGVMVYQEQVLNIAQRLAGYSLGQADLLRRAMGKKIKSEMDAQRKVFVEGAVKTEGGSPEKASALFDQIAKFAGYAFNKAHAMTYALISYQTAYMKANHPVAFMLASLNQDRQNVDRLALLVRDMKEQNMTLLPPDLNASSALFTEENGAIRYGLAALKNVGEGAMEALCAERSKNGPFRCVFDVFERLGTLRTLNKRQLEHLAWAGAFDSLGLTRRTVVENLETLLGYGSGQSDTPSLFDKTATRPHLKECERYPRSARLAYTHSAIGMYLNEHPMDPFTTFLKDAGLTPLEALDKQLADTTAATFAGVVMGVTVKRGRSGKKYAFVALSDATGGAEAILFEDLLNQKKEALQPGSLWVCHATNKTLGDSTRLIANKLTPLEDTLRATKHVVITVQDEAQLPTLAGHISAANKGRTQLWLKLGAEGTLCEGLGKVKLTPDLLEILWSDNLTCLPFTPPEVPVEPTPPTSSFSSSGFDMFDPSQVA